MARPGASPDDSVGAGRGGAVWLDRVTPLLPVVLYLAVRAVSVLVLAWMAARNSSTSSLTDILTEWDGRWYLGIADGGYDGVPADLIDAAGRRDDTTALAFLPGYPAVTAAVGALPGLGLIGAALWANVFAGGVAALGVARLGRTVTGSARAGLLLVALFAGWPMAVSLSMAYTEALFCALAVWALVAVLDRHWLLAGLLTASAGLVRMTAGALVLAVTLAALAALHDRRDGWRPVLALVLAPLGLVSWLGWVAVRTGHLNGYFDVQERGWDNGLGSAVGTGDHFVDVLSGRTVELMDVVSVVALLGSAVLLVLCAPRVPWPLAVYAGTTVAMVAFTSSLSQAHTRQLLPAVFVLLIPVVAGLAERRPSTQIAVATVVVLAGAWFGGYALVVYPFAI